MNDNLPRIKELMKEQGKLGRPTHHVILWGWDKLTDRHRTFHLDIAAPARPVQRGSQVYILEQPDSPELSPAEVLEDRGEHLWVRVTTGPSQSLVHIDDVRWAPIPLRPTVVHRRELWKFIGVKAYEQWRSMM